MPYIVTTKRSVDAVDAGHPEAPRNGWPVSRRAVATLEERIVFNSREWERAGYDQPDGNLQFFHHALILSRRPSRQRWMPKDEVAEVLWLHDGTISSGHFVGMMDMPSEPTRADRERFPDFPERWPGRLIPESGGTVGPLPDGTVIDVELVEYADLWPYDILGANWQQRTIDAFNTKEAR